MAARLAATALLGATLFALAPAGVAWAHDEAEEPAQIAAGEQAEAAGEADHEADEHHGPFYTQPQFFAAVINFVLLLLVLRRLGKQPLATFLGERRKAMERNIAEAAELKAKADARHKEYVERLAQLDQELQKLRTDIARAAEEDRQRILADAEETARRLRRETEALIDQHGRALSAAARREVVEAAMAAAEQLLRSTLTEADQQRLAERFKQSVAGERPEEAPPQPERKQPTPRITP
jgi:F-type H+-transporting ATPase subunit b